MTNAADLKALVDPVLRDLQAAVGERGAVIIMVAAPNGKHDSYYVAWDGPCLMAKGLREQWNAKLHDLIIFKESV